MLEKTTKENFITKDQWPKLLIILTAIVIIALLFPEVNNTYKLAIGDTWQEADLEAERNFEVSKSKEVLESEELLIKENFIPIFRRDEKVAALVAESITQEMQTIDLGETSDFEANENVINCLGKMYREGVYAPGSNYKDKISLPSGEKTSLILIKDLVPISQSQSSLTSRCGGAIWENPDLVSIVKKHLQPNLVYSKELTENALTAKLADIAQVEFEFKHGDVLIRKGQSITERELRILSNYDESLQIQDMFSAFSVVHFLGYLLLTCLIIGALLAYLIFHFPKLYEDNRRLIFILIWPVIFSFLVFVVEKNPGLTSFIIPFCIVPIIIKNFLNDRLALFLHIVIVLIASFLSSLGYEFTFLQILAGVVSILFFTKNFTLNSFFNTILIIFGTYILGYLGLELIQAEQLSDLNWRPLIPLGISAFLTLLAFPLMPLLERLFRFTSPITLNELSDLNRPLLNKLATEAPGTLQHSLQVSNLAHAAAEKIGGDTLLIKTAALYHDIGKLAYPNFFIENQSGSNPHESINNFESAEKIIGHSIEGEKMAKKAKLPQDIIDFITSHHGTTRVEYFYRNQLKAEPDREFDEALFRYPGPKPQTKEQSILMIADSLEAASKSLKNPTGQDIDRLVDNIIAGKIDNNQLDESKLTFHELEQCSEVFKSVLRSINHVRIEYPDEVVSTK